MEQVLKLNQINKNDVSLSAEGTEVVGMLENFVDLGFYRTYKGDYLHSCNRVLKCGCDCNDCFIVGV